MVYIFFLIDNYFFLKSTEITGFIFIFIII